MSQEKCGIYGSKLWKIQGVYADDWTINDISISNSISLLNFTNQLPNDRLSQLQTAELRRTSKQCKAITNNDVISKLPSVGRSSRDGARVRPWQSFKTVTWRPPLPPPARWIDIAPRRKTERLHTGIYFLLNLWNGSVSDGRILCCILLSAIVLSFVGRFVKYNLIVLNWMVQTNKLLFFIVLDN